MLLRLGLPVLLASAIAVSAAEPLTFVENPSPEHVGFFEKKIRPILVDHCLKCHAAEPVKTKGGLMLDSRAGVMAGGDSGAVIIPGSPEKSLLIKAVRSKDEKTAMPPKGKLPEQAVADLETWVKMGAPDPRTEAAKKPATVRGEIDIEKGRQFWAYQPLRETPIPQVKEKAWPTTPIDSYILASLEAKGLKPIADADNRTLVRRVYLDLIGLPPTPEQADAFLCDKTPDAYEKLIDTLLASPHFGERWGRHWLDVARFAETTGKTVNFNYPQAWRYRDYVIAAYNADKPFDRFITEQLAGDLLPASDDKTKAQNLIATGFLAVGAKQLNERNPTQYALDIADEQIDVTTQAFLGTTVACARCHDHKFDPIPMKDYYALVGIFRSSETCYGTVRFVQANHPSPLISLPAGSVPSAIEKLGDRERKLIEAEIAAIRTRAEKADLQQRILINAQLAIARGKLDQYDADGNPKLQTMGMRDRYRIADSPIYGRGEPDKAGDIAPRGVLQVMTSTQPKFDKATSGRLELAKWIAATGNPLTARVYVNRIWLHLFGRGLVPTPDNLGTSGHPPSNPALLDHLARDFMHDGWKTKTLIRKLMLSHSYRLASSFDATNFEADPDNALVWRMTPQRLDAEVVRDSILAVSGRLLHTPPVGSDVAKAGEGPSQRPRLGSSAIRLDGNDPHRSVYLPIVRDNLPESLSLFDAADPSLVVGERPSTTVPAQALFLMNNPFVIKSAEAAAENILANSSSDSERVRQAYLSFFGRPPTDAEMARAETFVTGKMNGWALMCQAMFGSAEFLLRK